MPRFDYAGNSPTWLYAPGTQINGMCVEYAMLLVRKNKQGPLYSPYMALIRRPVLNASCVPEFSDLTDGHTSLLHNVVEKPILFLY